jgi:hypothetical protein
LIAYKLLRPGRVAPFSGLEWPPPGDWLEANELDECRAGLHACRVDDLPLWLGLGELWEVELGGEVREQERKVVASRARLVRRVEEWNGAAAPFAEACVESAKRRAERSPDLAQYVPDLEANAAAGNAPVAAYIAARVAELQEGPTGYDAERRRQADWLAHELGLRSKRRSWLRRRHP